MGMLTVEAADQKDGPKSSPVQREEGINNFTV